MFLLFISLHFVFHSGPFRAFLVHSISFCCDSSVSLVWPVFVFFFFSRLLRFWCRTLHICYAKMDQHIACTHKNAIFVCFVFGVALRPTSTREHGSRQYRARCRISFASFLMSNLPSSCVNKRQNRAKATILFVCFRFWCWFDLLWGEMGSNCTKNRVFFSSASFQMSSSPPLCARVGQSATILGIGL